MLPILARRRGLALQPYPDITLGNRCGRLDLPDLSISEVVYPPGQTMGSHSHRNANVSLMLAGSCDETVGGRTWQVGAMSLVLKPAGAVHSNHYGPAGARSMIIELQENSDLARDLEKEVEGTARWISSAPIAARGLQTLGLSLASQLREGHSQQTIVEDITELLSFAFREQEDRLRWRRCVREAWTLLRESFPFPPSQKDVARTVGVHPVYLARAFRQQLGYSPTEFRRQLQIAEAARRLAETREPLSLIASAAGFSDQSHLTRTFRAQLGVTPGRFRRRFGNSI